MEVETAYSMWYDFFLQKNPWGNQKQRFVKYHNCIHHFKIDNIFFIVTEKGLKKIFLVFGILVTIIITSWLLAEDL